MKDYGDIDILFNQTSKYRRASWLLCITALLVAGTLMACASKSSSNPEIEPPVFSVSLTESPIPKSPATTPVNQTDSRICLNGLWDFRPLQLSSDEDDNSSWSKIWVPGSWKQCQGLPGFQPPGDSKTNAKTEEASRGFYRCKIRIPASWAGKQVSIKLERVSTDARILIKGKPCGDIQWPGGQVDISSAVNFGDETELVIEVAASDSSTDAASTLSHPLNLLPIKNSDEQPESKGLIGDVFLVAEPTASELKNVWIESSFRKKGITIHGNLELKNQAECELQTDIFDEAGMLVKSYQQHFPATASNKKLAAFATWNDPILWNMDQPKRYQARVRFSSGKVQEELWLDFGFREFWIAGKEFYLNGNKIRLRPSSINLLDWKLDNGVGMAESINSVLTGLKKNGFNCIELWPIDTDKRGTPDMCNWWYEQADKVGILICGIPPSPKTFLSSWAASRDRYRNLLDEELPEALNHPSLVMWTTMPNSGYSGSSLSPPFLGRKLPLTGGDADKREALKILSNLSGSKPSFCHSGFDCGDIFTLNLYLNFIPLQEREEWLKEWASTGDMPLMFGEFGTPLATSFQRGRGEYTFAVCTEPLVTEFAAIYLGPQAYETESQKYRTETASKFISHQNYKSWHDSPTIINEIAFQKIQSLFIENTWKSWRTAGLSGGCVPWARPYEWLEDSKLSNDRQNFQFTAGRLGTFFPQLPKPLLSYLQPPFWKLTQSGQTLINNNNKTLAWIAGAKGETGGFYGKEHHFSPGQTVSKQIAIINDGPGSKTYSVHWQASINNQALDSGELSGEVETAASVLAPIAFKLPSVSNKTVQSGQIKINGSIANSPINDSFTFQVYPTQNASTLPKIALLDPGGSTKKTFQEFNVPFTEKYDLSHDKTIAIGRNTLDSGAVKLSTFKKFVEDGGSLLIFAQDPQWINTFGLRTANNISRRAFPVNYANNPLNDSNSEDFRDWNGKGSLVPEYTTKEQYQKQEPSFGWHWGNTGSVASLSFEKPHYGSWKPLLESEFDLAYSPLLELSYGKGRVIFCGLDFEDRQKNEPAAQATLYKLLNHLSTAAATVRYSASDVIFAGSKKELISFRLLGAHASYESSIVTPKVLIVGNSISAEDPLVTKTLKAGGLVIFLRRDPGVYLGVEITSHTKFSGSLTVPPWKLCEGLSRSDLHWRGSLDSFLVSPGAEQGAQGLLGIKKIGPGTALFCQIDPNMFSADTLTYFRLTRWRQNRALCQILANAGVAFDADELFDEQARKTTQLYYPDYIAPDGDSFAVSDCPYRYSNW